MNFSAKEDINAPIEQVFAVVSDFDLVERAASGRGIEVSRGESETGAPVGTHWETSFDFRGKQRDAKITLCEHTPPDCLGFETKSGGLDTKVTLDLVALSPTKTRLKINAEMAPQTLSARLLVQSLRLAKTTANKRFQNGFSGAARLIEGRAKEMA